MNKFKAWLQRVMYGRYGTDKLNTAILVCGLILCLVGSFVPSDAVRALLTLASYVLLGISLWRTFSRNTYKRYQENRRYQMLLDRLKDRSHRYYTCPKCRQTVRVPKGKGKIAITCPKCKEKFVKKT
jgi:hypothetical protein